MKNKSKVPLVRLFGIIALVAVIVFSMTACGGDDGNNNDNSSNPQTVTYTGTSGGQTYTLKITENIARYTAQSGDTYELTVGTKKSTGTVSNAAGGVLTLKPSNAETTFTATISGTSLTALNNTITWTDNTTDAAPGALTGGGEPSGSEDGTFTITGIPAEHNGKYIYIPSMSATGQLISGFQSVDMSTGVTTSCLISNGSVSIPLWARSGDGFVRYSGNGTASYAYIYIFNSQTETSESKRIGMLLFEFDSGLTFVNGGATKSWNDGTYTENPNAP